MSRTGSLVVCAFLFSLLWITRTGLSPQHPGQHSASAGLKDEIDRVNAEIDRIFRDALAEMSSIPGDAGQRMKRVQTLGKLLLFDTQLSVNRNQACSFCHMPYVDFTGPISLVNMTTVAYPGSVRHSTGDAAKSRYGR